MQCHLYLLGKFDIQCADSAGSPRRKTRALLGYLAASGEAHRRTALADMFCTRAKAPARTLRLLLSRIRKLHPDMVVTDGTSVRINRQAVWVDVSAFRSTLEGDLAACPVEPLSEAVELYRGELLEGLSLPDAPDFELWLVGARAHLRRLYERGLHELIERMIASSDYEPALTYAQQLLLSNPLLEEAHARLIWLYARTGQRDAALAQYEYCRELLADELAVEPTPALQSLYDEVVAGRLHASPRTSAPATLAGEPAHSVSDFIGRGAELARLGDIWTQATVGGGAVVLMDAEAGGGKTRLVHEFVQAHVSSPECTLWAQCYESTQTLPFHPWIEVLQTHAANVAAERLGQLSPFARDYLGRLLPDLARRLDTPPPAPPTAGSELERLFAAVAELLELTQAPLFIFIDDVQWADETSLRLFHFLARRNKDSSMLLAGAFRSEERADVPALQTLIHDLRGAALHRIHLNPLDRDDIGALIDRMWPALPAGYRPHVVDMLANATGGNALFVTEVIAELAHSSDVPTDVPVPASVRDLIRRRLQRLPDSSRQVIEAMAVFDAPATLEQAQQTSARSENEVVAAIDAGMQRGLLDSVADTGSSRYDFSHDLLRQAVVGEISSVRRQILHRRAATTLEASGAPPATLAYHWARAGNESKEREYAARAGTQAAEQFANAEAITYLSRALTLLAADADAEARYDLLKTRERVYSRQGDREAQHNDLEAMSGLAEALDDDRRRAEVARRQADYATSISEYAAATVVAEEAVALARRAVDIAGEASGYLAWGIALWRDGQFDEARRRLEQALPSAREEHLPRVEADALLVLGNVSWSLGSYEQARAHMAEALAVCQRAGFRAIEANVRNNLGVIALELGAYGDALSHYREALAIHREVGSRQGEANVLGNLSGVYLDVGRYEEARRHLGRSLLLYREIGDRHGESIQLATLGLVHHYVKENEAAAEYGQQALALAEALDAGYARGIALTCLGHTLAALNRLDDARDAYQQAYKVRREMGQETLAVESLAGVADVLRRQGDAKALSHVEEVLRHLETDTLNGAHDPIRVYLTCYRVLTAADDPRAAGLLREAHEFLQQRAAGTTSGRDEALRRSYLNNVPHHRELLAIADS